MSSSTKIGSYRWTICALLFVATTVNYLDRQVLSLLQPHLEELYGWTNSDYANITAAFQLFYAIAMLFAGKFIDKIGTKWGYAVAIIVWSLGALVHAYSVDIGTGIGGILKVFGITVWSASVLGFMASRMVLALGEAGNFPAAIKATAEYFPQKERSLATGIFNSGANIGAIIAPIAIPRIEALWGWEAAFVIVGLFGFVWLAFWLVFYEKPEKQKRLSKAELEYITEGVPAVHAAPSEDVPVEQKIKWSTLLGFRQTWAFVVGKALTDGVWWFFLFWLPAYLKSNYQLVGDAISLPLAILYSLSMIGSISGGWLPVFFINRGLPAFDGRRRAMLLIALVPLIVLAAQPLGYISYWVPVLLIGIGTAAHQAWSANIFTTVSDMFPKKAIGSIVGIGGMAGGLGGVIISKAGGALFDHYKAQGHIETGYTIMFAFCATAYILAWVLMKLLVPKHKMVEI
ncbi:ACS family hexuronate transporter-like MFS transporter [Filimonas zeae]|uniref:Hexuronate transporter n=1 Tax=Filimonas zeae TaxID=1737353 RepID=A0A917MS84_9BACT|nr:MFS transporter [Filimonas zeae]MDR6337230.1 ACS family hexuronate transporter-like MFS transporter [Filimonas zeae]GGH57610.1 hexuronate transporter [Filimonas zeae]